MGRGFASVLLVALLALASAACGDEEPTETGGLATTGTESTTTEPEEPIGSQPPPTGPLDPLVVDRLGRLELDVHAGAPQIRELGAEDARDLGYLEADGDGAVITLARFPTPARARAYGRQYAAVLDADQGFDMRGGREEFSGPRGEGFIVRLDDGEGTEAAVWTTGALFVGVLADPVSMKTVIERAPYGRGSGAGSGG